MNRLSISYEYASLRSAGAIELLNALASVANHLRVEGDKDGEMRS